MNESQETSPESTQEQPISPKVAPKSPPNEFFERSTVIAFGTLFVLPALIILFTVLFFLPYILSTLTADPSGVSAPAPNVVPPSRQ